MLPVNNFAENFCLLKTGSAQIDTGCFYAVMAKEIGKEGDITAAFNEISGKQVAEGVGIQDMGIQQIPSAKYLKLGSDSGGSNGRAQMTQK